MLQPIASNDELLFPQGATSATVCLCDLRSRIRQRVLIDSPMSLTPSVSLVILFSKHRLSAGSYHRAILPPSILIGRESHPLKKKPVIARLLITVTNREV